MLVQVFPDGRARASDHIAYICMLAVLSLPLATLDTDEKVLYLIGVNHVETGLATFINIAPTDIVLRMGLEAWATPEVCLDYLLGLL